MGSHWRHRSANTWSAVTDSFMWGVSLSEGTPHLKIWTHFRFDSCFTEVFSMKDQWVIWAASSPFGSKGSPFCLLPVSIQTSRDFCAASKSLPPPGDESFPLGPESGSLHPTDFMLKQMRFRYGDFLTALLLKFYIGYNKWSCIQPWPCIHCSKQYIVITSWKTSVFS